VTFVNISAAKSIADLETFRLNKLLRVVKFLTIETWYLLTRRFDFFCCPVSVNRNAFLKDALLLGWARLFRVPTVLYAHGNNVPDFHDHAPRWLQQLIDRTIRHAGGAIVLGNSLRFNFDRWLPPEKIFVAPIGIEIQTALPEIQKKPGTVTVLYLGNLVREKGVFVLLEAAAAVVKQRTNVRFVFGGPWFLKQDEKQAREFVAQHGLEKSVEFAGPVAGESKWRLLLGADMLAFPTFYYYETMGLVMLEAMQVGLPVIATRRASIPEIVQDGIHGLLIEEQNARDLTEKILRLVDDPGLRTRLGDEGRQRFAAYYTHEHYGQRMIQVFENLFHA